MRLAVYGILRFQGVDVVTVVCKYKKRTCTYLGAKSAVREKKDGEGGLKEREGDRSVNYYPANEREENVKTSVVKLDN